LSECADSYRHYKIKELPEENSSTRHLFSYSVHSKILKILIQTIFCAAKIMDLLHISKCIVLFFVIAEVVAGEFGYAVFFVNGFSAWRLAIVVHARQSLASSTAYVTQLPNNPRCLRYAEQGQMKPTSNCVKP
jgi:hypothetical protein